MSDEKRAKIKRVMRRGWALYKYKIKMNKQKKGLAISLSMLVLFVVFATFATQALTPPTATHFGVEDTRGYKDTYVLIPVNITNVQNGPIPAVVFNVLYDNSVLNVVDVQRGALTSNWKDPRLIVTMSGAPGSR